MTYRGERFIYLLQLDRNVINRCDLWPIVMNIEQILKILFKIYY